MTTQTTATAARTTWAHRPDQQLTDETLTRVDSWWRAANYLSVGQIYLLDNPCSASRCGPSTSSPACSGTGARPRA